MAKNFPGCLVSFGPRLTPHNSALSVYDKIYEIGYAVVSRSGIRDADKRKHREALLDQRRFCLRAEYQAWSARRKKTETCAVNVFWELEADQIYRKLKETDPTLARMLRRKDARGYLSASTVRRIVR